MGDCSPWGKPLGYVTCHPGRLSLLQYGMGYGKMNNSFRAE